MRQVIVWAQQTLGGIELGIAIYNQDLLPMLKRKCMSQGRGILSGPVADCYSRGESITDRGSIYLIERDFLAA
jgi:hypothetical protein